MIDVTGSYVTVPNQVTQFAAAHKVPLFVHVVIVHPVVVQFFQPSAFVQNQAQVTHPGAIIGAPPTTALVAKAVLFPVFQSLAFVSDTLKVTELPLAAG